MDRFDLLAARRLMNGLKTYGCLDLETDPRDFVTEAEEELLDCVNYLRFAQGRGELPPFAAQWIVRNIKHLLVTLRHYRNNPSLQ